MLHHISTPNTIQEFGAHLWVHWFPFGWHDFQSVCGQWCQMSQVLCISRWEFPQCTDVCVCKGVCVHELSVPGLDVNRIATWNDCCMKYFSRIALWIVDLDTWRHSYLNDLDGIFFTIVHSLVWIQNMDTIMETQLNWSLTIHAPHSFTVKFDLCQFSCDHVGAGAQDAGCDFCWQLYYIMSLGLIAI